MSVKIAGSRVVITGAGSGIGEATALRCAKQGAKVVAVDIDPTSAERTAAACDELTPGASAYECDVADAAAVQALAARVETDDGPVDVLVNNAGVGVAGPFLESSIEDWDWLRGINIDGVAYGCYAFGPAMVARGHGHVVNIASGAGYIPNKSMAAYCASKAAVISLSQCLRADWRSHGVGVSVVCPGVIATPIVSNTRMVGEMEGRRERAARGLSMGHSPDLVAKEIIRAVERNRELVPAGLESSVAYHLLRITPSPIRGLVARAGLP
jgi:NAD(P)-dependent dehydrogenase (short-subunit alcohol dehydrogenase family)